MDPVGRRFNQSKHRGEEKYHHFSKDIGVTMHSKSLFQLRIKTLNRKKSEKIATIQNNQTNQRNFLIMLLRINKALTKKTRENTKKIGNIYTESKLNFSDISIKRLKNGMKDSQLFYFLGYN